MYNVLAVLKIIHSIFLCVLYLFNFNFFPDESMIHWCSFLLLLLLFAISRSTCTSVAVQVEPSDFQTVQEVTKDRWEIFCSYGNSIWSQLVFVIMSRSCSSKCLDKVRHDSTGTWVNKMQKAIKKHCVMLRVGSPS